MSCPSLSSPPCSVNYGDDNVEDAMLQITLHSTIYLLTGIMESTASTVRDELTLSLIPTLLCTLWGCLWEMPCSRWIFIVHCVHSPVFV